MSVESTIKGLIRDVPDFPKPGILFKDITPLLQSGPAFKQVIDYLEVRYRHRGISTLAAIESRGFIFAAALAHAMGIGFTLIRKPGKLPAGTEKLAYELEYGTDALEVHKDGIGAGERVLIVDDLLATGGTARAAAKLIEKVGGHVVELVFILELMGIGGAEKVAQWPTHSLAKYVMDA